MKALVNVIIFLTPTVGYLFTIKAFYANPNQVPDPYSGSLIYLVSSVILLILSLVYTKYSRPMWLTIVINSIYILFALSALIFSLIAWYDIPKDYFNSLSNTIFTISIMITYLGIVSINRKTRFKNYMTLLWISFFISALYIGISSSLIHAYNSPDEVSHILYGSFIYIFTAAVLSAFTFLVSFYSNKIILYSAIFGNLAFLWIGLKLTYSSITKFSDKGSTFILGISILMVLFSISSSRMSRRKRSKERKGERER